MNYKLATSVAALTSLILIQAVLSQTAVQSPTVALRYGQIPSTIKAVSAVPFYIAQHKGFFRREGINLKMVPIEGGTDNMIAALDKGRVDITRTATPYLVQAVLKGSEAVAFAGETATPIYSLIVKPEIRTFADLKGKTVALSLPIDPISVSARKLMALHGVQDGSFNVKELVGTPDRAACLRRGECDAVPVGQPDDFILMDQGYQRLGISTDAMPKFQFTVTAVRRSWGEKNKETVVRYVRALAAAYRFMRDPATRDEAVKLFIDTTGTSEDIARKNLALYFEPDRSVIPKQGEIDLEGLGQVIQMMSEVGELKPPLPSPNKFVDLQYLHAAGIQ